MPKQTMKTKESKLAELEKRIFVIEKRNKKVEADKCWETSTVRRVLVAVMTYLVIVLFFVFAGLPKPFVNSIVPTVGFVLSTLSLPYFRKVFTR